MSQERPPTLIDGEKAHEIWKAVLSGYEGEFAPYDRFGYSFKGQGSKGRFLVTFQSYGAYVSIGADLSESGVGSPCDTLARVREATEEATKFCGMKRKEFEQLKLW